MFDVRYERPDEIKVFNIFFDKKPVMKVEPDSVGKFFEKQLPVSINIVGRGQFKQCQDIISEMKREFFYLHFLAPNGQDKAISGSIIRIDTRQKFGWSRGIKCEPGLLRSCLEDKSTSSRISKVQASIKVKKFFRNGNTLPLNSCARSKKVFNALFSVRVKL
jgi:hypothetical protein